MRTELRPRLGPDISLPSEASIDPLKSAFTAGLGPPVSQGDGLGPARDCAAADRGQRRLQLHGHDTLHCGTRATLIAAARFCISNRRSALER